MLTPQSLCYWELISLLVFDNLKMRNKTQQGFKLLEELDVPHQAQGWPQGVESHIGGSKLEKEVMPTNQLSARKEEEEPSDPPGQMRHLFCFSKWKGLCALADTRRRKMRCLVSLQVHKVRDLPFSMNGKALIVGWKRKGWEGEQTLPVNATEGTASFDEIFLHYCNVKSPGTLKSFNIWVSSVDARECDLGSFHVDLSEMVSSGNLNSKFGGKAMTFNLCGAADGSTLVASFYYTIIEAESRELEHMRCDSIGQKQRKSKCFSCLPDLKCSKNSSPNGLARQVSTVEPDIGFITIENSTRIRHCIDDEEEGFITIEKGLTRTRSQRPPSDNTRSWDSDEAKDGGFGKEKLLLVACEESEIDQVEDEFLRMLEEKQGKPGECEISAAMLPWEKKLVNLNLNLDLGIDLDFDWDLDSMMMAAEKEMFKATQVWNSRIEARALEQAEYEELMKRWESDEMACQSSSSLETCVGFGSPI